MRDCGQIMLLPTDPNTRSWLGIEPQFPAGDPEPELVTGRYDPQRRRRGVRKGAEAGCWVYIPAEELRKAGFRRGERPPFYRLWGRRRGSILLRLYREP